MEQTIFFRTKKSSSDQKKFLKVKTYKECSQTKIDPNGAEKRP